MSDRRVRQLERDHLEAPWCVDLKTRWIQEWLRAGAECPDCESDGKVFREDSENPGSLCMTGELKTCPRCAGLSRRKRVELAAHCKDEAARRALSLAVNEDILDPLLEVFEELHPTDSIPDHLKKVARRNPRGTEIARALQTYPDRMDLGSWVVSLTTWGPFVLVRSAVATGWVTHYAEAAKRKERWDYDDPLHQAWLALKAAEAWLACPSEKNKEACATATHVSLIGEPTSYDDWWRRVCTAIWMEDPRQEWCEVAIQSAARATSEAAVRGAIRMELVKWALR